jgi:hypothetical protein
MLSQFADFSALSEDATVPPTGKAGNVCHDGKDRADEACTTVPSAVGPWMGSYWLPRRNRTLLESEEEDLTAVRGGYSGETTPVMRRPQVRDGARRNRCYSHV